VLTALGLAVPTNESPDETLPVIGYVVKGADGSHPGSAHIRLLRRFGSLTGRVRFEAVDFDNLGALRRMYAVVVVRDAASAAEARALLEALRHTTCRLVVELDDDLVSSAATRRLIENDFEATRLRALRRIIAAADVAVVSNKMLAGVVSGLAAETVVIPNGLDRELWATPMPTLEPEGELRILYMGTYTHEDDLRSIREPIERLRRHHDVKLEAVGVTTANDDWYDRLEVPQDDREYPAFVSWLRQHSARWTIAVAPLVDTSFNTSKSDLKTLEYSMLGLPTVASAVEPYLDSVKFGVTLASGDEEWFDAIEALLVDRRLRATRAARAARYVLDHRMLDLREIEGRWLRAVVGRSRARAISR
jgi:glycosyltransferase involved in cell wall biosynthesis